MHYSQLNPEREKESYSINFQKMSLRSQNREQTEAQQIHSNAPQNGNGQSNELTTYQQKHLINHIDFHNFQKERQGIKEKNKENLYKGLSQDQLQIYIKFQNIRSYYYRQHDPKLSYKEIRLRIRQEWQKYHKNRMNSTQRTGKEKQQIQNKNKNITNPVTSQNYSKQQCSTILADQLNPKKREDDHFVEKTFKRQNNMIRYNFR